MTLSDLGAGDWLFDDFGLYTQAVAIDDAEGDVPFAADGSTVGLFPWASDGAAVTLDATRMDRPGAPTGNHVLSGTYDVPDGGWGGFTHNLPAAEDWRSFRGIRMAWYASQENNPASPTAGETVTVEIKDGGPDGEDAEKWTATFLDRWGSSTDRWKVAEIPFDMFELTSGEIDGVLDLTSAWGYAVAFPSAPDGAIRYAIDDVELFGTARASADVSIHPADVTLVDPGETAQVPVVVTTNDGGPLAGDVTASYSSAAGTAEAGTHYTEVSGSLTFPAGAPSGTTQTIELHTLASAAEDVARVLSLDISSTAAAVATPASVVLNAVGMPYLDESLPDDDRAQDLLARMTLEEKAGQMAQAERLGLQSVDDIAELGLGSLLSGGGSVPDDNSPAGWADMVDGYQRQALSTRLQIPLVYGIDAVHGHNNVVGATIFPHNQSLGATRDPALAGEVAAATAAEVRATGIPWTFAPCLCVTRDERWGRSYESFGEDPALVSSFAGPTVTGLQGTDPDDMSAPNEVLATAKHWVGDGGTTYVPELAGSGYPIDQGVTHVPSRQVLDELHVAPYLPAVDSGVGSIMPSYSAVSIDGGTPVPMHENTELNTGLFKGELGFDGFLVTDWEAIDKLPSGTYADKVRRSVNSGLDMGMAPYNYREFIGAVVGHVNAGTVQTSRVDDAVTRILSRKFALGLFDQPFADRSLQTTIGSAEHRATAREAAGKSQVLLKNDGDVLPLAKDAHIYLAGSNADDLGNQMGGWSISWQGGSGDTTQGTSILEGIREVASDASVTYSKDASAPVGDATVGVVVVGERPYAEGVGDVGNNGFSMSLSPADTGAIDTVCGAVADCVVLVISGRPQLLSDRLGDVDAVVASWLPGSEGAGVADTLFGDRSFTGRLPLTWPADAAQLPINVGDDRYDPAFAYGWGLRTDAPRDRLTAAAAGLPEGAARDAVLALRDADAWSAEGDLEATAEAVERARAAAAGLGGAEDVALAAAAGLVVSVVRDLAQSSIEQAGPGSPVNAEALTADAEHALLSGDPAGAVDLLVEAAGV